MTAAYFEDHPTDPEKVILRKPYSTDCPNCEYHKNRAARWRAEAYAQAGHPLPEREWVGLTELEKAEITSLKWWDWEDTFDIEGFIRAIEAKIKEKNT